MFASGRFLRSVTIITSVAIVTSINGVTTITERRLPPSRMPTEAECLGHWSKRINRIVYGNQDLHFHSSYHTSLCFKHVPKGPTFYCSKRGHKPWNALFDIYRLCLLP